MSIVVLLTDFGTRDWYVAVMKSVILRICSGARIIDLSHEIPPQRTDAAAFVLWNAYRWFPEGSIFVCVVDPDVGSQRRILALQAGGHTFLAPDNGLLDLVLQKENPVCCVEVTNARYFLHPVSNTFHGRDIFAPVAAHLANGIPITDLGPPTPCPTPELKLIEATAPGAYQGKVIYVDRFGNLITNLQLMAEARGEVRLKNLTIPKLLNTYSDSAEGGTLALRGSSGLLEISVEKGNAASILSADYGTKVTFSCTR